MKDIYILIQTRTRKRKLTYSESDEVEEECIRLAKKGCLVNHRTVPGWSKAEWFSDIWEVDENNNIVTETKASSETSNSSEQKNNITLDSLNEYEEADLSSIGKKTLNQTIQRILVLQEQVRPLI